MHFPNLFDGVKHKFEYRMRLVYAYFPINAKIINGGKFLEIRNYLGEKFMHTVIAVHGIIVVKTSGVVLSRTRMKTEKNY